MSTELTARVTSVFQDVFTDSLPVITRQTTAADIEEWDSLTHIDLIVAIEREFKVRFTTAEVSGMKNVGDLLDILSRKLT